VPTAADDALDLEVGGRSLAANLERAIESGVVLRQEDGRLALRRGPDDADEVRRKGGFIGQRGTLKRSCEFLNHFLFEQVYAGAAVPFGCRNCYKIRISTRSLRALMAVKDIAESTEYTTKSGPDVDNPYNQSLYATCLYFDGLEEAQKAYDHLRPRLDQHEFLGPGVVMMIKRGCSNYERRLGPSDAYEIDPRLEAVEAGLAERYIDSHKPSVIPKETIKALRMLELVGIAYRIGDETYTDFTGGKPLYPPPVNYAKTAACASEGQAPAVTASG
jgi:hypothetical protein